MANIVVKGSLHSGRARWSDKHNDHDFMDDDKRDVKIKTYAYGEDLRDANGWMGITGGLELMLRENQLKNKCHDDEIKFYEHCFKHTLDAQNAKHIAAGHRKRVKNMEEYKKAYPPVEDVLQVGNKDTGNLPAGVLETCVEELVEWEKQTLGRNYLPISIAYHYDETTYHAHQRGVFVYWDDNGNPVPCMKDALKQAGIPLAHPDKPESQFNNRKKAYDAMRRDAWLSILEKHLPKDYVLDKSVDRDRQFGHMSVDAYTAYKQAETANKQEAERLQVMADELEARELELNTWEVDLNDRETALKARESDLDSRLENIKAKEAEALKRANKASEREKALKDREEECSKRESKIDFNEKSIKFREQNYQNMRNDVRKFIENVSDYQLKQQAYRLDERLKKLSEMPTMTPTSNDTDMQYD